MGLSGKDRFSYIQAKEAAALKTLLAESFADALATEKRHFGRKWSYWMEAGRLRLEWKAAAGPPRVAEALNALREDELTCVLAVKHKRFAARLSSDLEKRDLTRRSRKKRL
jgi:hypothetical protein